MSRVKLTFHYNSWKLLATWSFQPQGHH